MVAWQKAAGGVGRAVRDGWLMLGVTVLMFLVLEGGYRLVAGPGVTVQRATQVPPGHPYENVAWYQEFNEGNSGPNGRRFLVDPYRFHRLGAMATKFLTVDSLGHRRTVNVLRDSATALRVFMLGGSTMWGFTARDSFTIPSNVASALRQKGFDNVEVVNLAEAGYNTTQEATTVLYEVAKGRIPAVAVFLNGYNDMATSFKWGGPGNVFELDLTQKKVDAFRRGFWGDLFDLSLHSRLIARLAPAPDVQDVPVVDKPGVCQSVAAYYRQIALSMAGVGRSHGFEVFYFLQPVHHTTRKPLTGFEKTLRIEPAFQACTTAIDSAMADWKDKNYFQAYRWLDDYQEGAFVDRNSHITEAANQVVAQRIADIIEPVLRAKMPATP